MPDEQFIPLAPLLGTLGMMLTFSLIVERFLSIISWLMDRLSIIKASDEWSVIDEQKEKLELAKQAKQEEEILKSSPDKTQKPSKDLREIEPNPAKNTADFQFEVKNYELSEPIKVIKEYWLQLFGVLVAVIACYYMKFSIWDLVVKMKGAQGPQAVNFSVFGYIFTGIIIGVGSKPVHFLMNFLINRKIMVTKSEVTEVSPPVTIPQPMNVIAATKFVPSSPNIGPALEGIEDIVGFNYDGGYHPDRLENTHFFQAPVNLIVYHHTALHSDSPFEEVVKEFERKGWLTGYHCIIFKNGAIRVLCRWDRFGNHAYPHNQNSLGIAFHGNFETNPNVPYANVNGSYGIANPTQAQLDSASKIIVLWKHLYDIDVIFPKENDSKFPSGIVPHYMLSSKACPGTNFPHELFQQFIKDYNNLWKDNETFKSALKRFKNAPMVTWKEA
jgi:hypothetical protein